MLMTEDEKEPLAKLAWRKRKIIEEEQIRLNDFNAEQRRLLIFSHIFRIVPKLKALPKQTRRKKSKLRVIQLIQFHQRISDENTEKNKHQKADMHLTLFDNHRLGHRQKKVATIKILKIDPYKTF